MEENSEYSLSKILLMGKVGVGKTSMRSIIFANQAPKDTFMTQFTHDVSESKLNFMGDLTFNLLDCGGQEEFIKQYFETKKESIFSQVKVLIFVIEAEPNAELSKDDKIDDIYYFEK